MGTHCGGVLGEQQVGGDEEVDPARAEVQAQTDGAAAVVEATNSFP